MGWAFAGTVLVSAFLLFQVQPLISKFILPWFGGSPAVWTTCMLFFQVLLFAGYSYAHLCQRLLRPRAQGVLHLGLLLLAFGLLHVEPNASWKPPDSTQPTWRILQLLLASVGLPYFALSATGPLLQAWFSRAYPGRSPYRLYALSNVGSLAALLTYPFVFEPAFDVIEQIWLWSLAFWLFVALCGACAVYIARRHWHATVLGAAPATAAQAEEPLPAAGDGSPQPARLASLERPENPPSWWRRFTWLGLPACASLMLLATTNHVCQDVAVIPFLWVVPLSLYLLTFIICFDHERWYVRPLFSALTLVLLYAVIQLPELQAYFRGVFHIAADEKNYKLELFVYFAAMFCVCMICHGELVRSRPGSHYLTEFYLLTSAGGALGGIFVSLIAPQIFHTFVEWRIALAAGCTLAVVLFTWSCGRAATLRPSWVLGGAVPLALAAAAWVAYADDDDDDDRPLAIARNFYGVVTVWDIDDASANNHRTLTNGHVVHGRQFTDPARRNSLISYYPFYSGVGQAVEFFQDLPSRKVGTIGLGVGTMAAYARPEDEFRFYEINPAVVDMAHKYFTFLQDCRGKVDVVLGDARLSLEREEPHGFHVLVVDAFSGDAIPTHLLTREAFEIYLKHLAPQGILAIHITNRYLNLYPVVLDLADHFQLGTTRIDVPEDQPKMINRSHWMLVTRNQEFLQSHPPQFDEDEATKRARPTRLWTDHYSNLFEILY